MAKSKTRRNNVYYMDRVTAYRWDRAEPDTDMQWICDRIIEQGLTAADVVRRVYEASNHGILLHYKTIEKWLDGTTRKPQNVTLTWVSIALGYERRWVKVR